MKDYLEAPIYNPNTVAVAPTPTPTKVAPTTPANSPTIQGYVQGKPIYAGSDASIAEQYKTITTDSLKPVAPLTIPTPTDSRTASNNLGIIAGEVVGGADTYLKNLTADTTARSQKNELLKKASDLMKIQETQGEFTLQAEKDAELGINREELTRLNNLALTKKKSYEDRIKALRENPSGMLEASLNAQIDELSRKGNEELANIGIQQQVAQNNVALAQQIVSDKVKAKFEPIDNTIKNLTTLSSLWSNDLTESEKVLLNARISEMSDKRKVNADIYKTVSERLLDNGAPLSVFNAVDDAANDPNATPASISAAAGKYGAKPTGVKPDGTPITPTASAETLDLMNLTQSIIDNPQLPNVVGVKSPGAWFGGFFGRMVGSPTIEVQNQIKQLKANLSLENRQKLKGSGAVSDFEARTLERSATALDSGLSNEAALRELKKIKGVMANASGLLAQVKLTDLRTKQSQIVYSDRNGINQAIIDGLTVEYQ